MTQTVPHDVTSLCTHIHIKNTDMLSLFHTALCTGAGSVFQVDHLAVRPRRSTCDRSPTLSPSPHTNRRPCLPPSHGKLPRREPYNNVRAFAKFLIGTPSIIRRQSLNSVMTSQSSLYYYPRSGFPSPKEILHETRQPTKNPTHPRTFHHILHMYRVITPPICVVDYT